MNAPSPRSSAEEITPDGDADPRTRVTATLAVRRGKDAVTFYQRAFGAHVLHLVEDDSGAIVAQLSIQGAEFWVSDESPEHGNCSPETLGGASVRMLLITPNPDGVHRAAVEAGAKEVCPMGEGHGWRLGRVRDPFGHYWEIGKKLGR